MIQATIPSRYEYVNNIDKGNFGEVLLYNDTISKNQVAIKITPKDRYKVDKEYFYSLLMTEIESLKQLKSPYIIGYVDHFEDEKNVYLVMEYFPGTSLKSYIPFEEQLAVDYMVQLFLAMGEMKRKKISHRDIKPDNVLVNKGHLKLVDFGFAKRAQTSNELAKTSLGTPGYKAPEVQSKKYDPMQADVYSLGIFLHVLLTGRVPAFTYQGGLGDQSQINQEDLSFVDNLTCRDEVKLLLKGMLQYNPKERLRIEQIIQLPLLQSHQLIQKIKEEHASMIEIPKSLIDPNHSQEQQKAIQEMEIKLKWIKISLKGMIHVIGNEQMYRESNFKEVRLLNYLTHYLAFTLMEFKHKILDLSNFQTNNFFGINQNIFDAQSIQLLFENFKQHYVDKTVNKFNTNIRDQLIPYIERIKKYQDSHKVLDRLISYKETLVKPPRWSEYFQQIKKEFFKGVVQTAQKSVEPYFFEFCSSLVAIENPTQYQDFDGDNLDYIKDPVQRKQKVIKMLETSIPECN